MKLLILSALVICASCASLTQPSQRLRRSLLHNALSTHARLRRRASSHEMRSPKENRSNRSDFRSDEAGVALLAALFGGSNSFENMACFEKCQPKLDKLDSHNDDDSASSEEISAEEIQRRMRLAAIGGEMEIPDFSGIFRSARNGSEFNETQFEQMCIDFVDAKDCIDKCGPGFFTNMITSAFRPLEYICIVNKEGFKKAAECGFSAGESEECDEKCPKLPESGENEKGSPFGNFGAVCSMTLCQLECTKPLVIEACDGDEEAGRVYENTVVHLISGTLGAVKVFGMDPDNIDECKELNSLADELPSQKKIRESPQMPLFGRFGNEARAQQVLTKTLVLLDKESEKIDLELELLRLQIAKEQKCENFCPGAPVPSAFTMT